MFCLHHIGITCSDIVASERFYVENFGLLKIKEKVESAEIIQQIFGINSPARIVLLKSGETMVELFEFPEVDHQPIMGSVSHFALCVADTKKAYEKLKAKGIETIMIDRGKEKHIYFVKDPDGVLIELRD